MRARIFTAVGILFFSLPACSRYARKPQPPAPPVTFQGKPILKGSLESIGLGIPESKLIDPEKKKVSAYRNAVENALREMEQMVTGLQTPTGETLRNFIARDPENLKRLRAVLKKYEVTRKDWTQDGGCVVHLQIQKSLIEKKFKVNLK